MVIIIELICEKWECDLLLVFSLFSLLLLLFFGIEFQVACDAFVCTFHMELWKTVVHLPDQTNAILSLRSFRVDGSSCRMLPIWLQVFMTWIPDIQSIRYAVASTRWRIYVMTSTKRFTPTYRRWQTQLRKRAWPCVIYHRKLNGPCCVCRIQPVKRHNILAQPTPTYANTTFMCIMHCWPYAQRYCWCLCASYAVYCAAFAANGPTAMAMTAAIKELAHDSWFCKWSFFFSTFPQPPITNPNSFAALLPSSSWRHPFYWRSVWSFS